MGNWLVEKKLLHPIHHVRFVIFPLVLARNCVARDFSGLYFFWPLYSLTPGFSIWQCLTIFSGKSELKTFICLSCPEHELKYKAVTVFAGIFPKSASLIRIVVRILVNLAMPSSIMNHSKP